MTCNREVEAALATYRCSAEMRLLLQLVRQEVEPGAVSASGERSREGQEWENLDWEELLALARHHRVYPLLYEVLCAAETPPEAQACIQQLAHDYRRNTLRMLQLGTETLRLQARMDERGIRMLSLKGPALAQQLYGDLSRRTSKDLDVLVPDEQVEAAELVLGELGYCLAQDVPRAFKGLKRKTHHLSYVHPGTGVQVELHWRLHPSTETGATFDELWARRQSSGASAAVGVLLGDEDLLLYLSVHGARHGWFRLRWLTDIDLLLRQGDLAVRAMRLLQTRRRGDETRMLAQALLLAHSLLGTPLPGELLKAVEALGATSLAVRALPFMMQKCDMCPAPKDRQLARLYSSYLRVLMSPGARMRHLVGKLYPSFKDTRTLPLPRALHFLYLPLRPLLWLLRKVS